MILRKEAGWAKILRLLWIASSAVHLSIGCPLPAPWLDFILGPLSTIVHNCPQFPHNCQHADQFSTLVLDAH